MEKILGDEELTLRYENGLFRNLNSSGDLRIIGRENARGDVTFKNIRNCALNKHTQEKAMGKYGTLSVDEVLEANLSEQKRLVSS